MASFDRGECSNSHQGRADGPSGLYTQRNAIGLIAGPLRPPRQLPNTASAFSNPPPWPEPC